MTHRIAEITAPEVASRLAAGAVAILPMGSLETHGPALPMGDYLVAEEIAARIAAAAAALGADALVAPAIPFGGEDFFAGVAGRHHPVHPDAHRRHRRRRPRPSSAPARARILIVNGHAGTIGPAEAAARAARHRHGVIIPALHLWREAGKLHAELGGARRDLRPWRRPGGLGDDAPAPRSLPPRGGAPARGDRPLPRPAADRLRRHPQPWRGFRRADVGRGSRARRRRRPRPARRQSRRMAAPSPTAWSPPVPRCACSCATTRREACTRHATARFR